MQTGQLLRVGEVNSRAHIVSHTSIVGVLHYAYHRKHFRAGLFA